MGEIPLGIRGDGINLSEATAPRDVWNAAVKKIQEPVWSPEIIEGVLDDFADLHLIGATEVPELQEKMLELGQDPELWRAQYQRIKTQIEKDDPKNIQSSLEVASFMGMDRESDDPNRQVVATWINQQKAQHVPDNTNAGGEDEIDNKGANNKEIDYEKEVERLESQVIARAAYGKFPATVHLKDIEFHHDNSAEHNSYGDVNEAGFSFNWKLPADLLGSRRIHSALYENERGHDLPKKHFIMATGIPNAPDEAMVTYSLPVAWADSGGRHARNAINFRMPRAAAARLMGLIRRNPDVAELFLQKAAAGFEATPDTIGKSGIPRIKSDGIVVINFDQFKDKSLFTKSISSDAAIITNIFQAILRNEHGEITEYLYSKPYGVAEPPSSRPPENTGPDPLLERAKRLVDSARTISVNDLKTILKIDDASATKVYRQLQDIGYAIEGIKIFDDEAIAGMSNEEAERLWSAAKFRLGNTEMDPKTRDKLQEYVIQLFHAKDRGVRAPAGASPAPAPTPIPAAPDLRNQPPAIETIRITDNRRPLDDQVNEALARTNQTRIRFETSDPIILAEFMKKQKLKFGASFKRFGLSWQTGGLYVDGEVSHLLVGNAPFRGLIVSRPDGNGVTLTNSDIHLSDRMKANKGIVEAVNKALADIDSTIKDEIAGKLDKKKNSKWQVSNLRIIGNNIQLEFRKAA